MPAVIVILLSSSYAQDKKMLVLTIDSVIQKSYSRPVEEAKMVRGECSSGELRLSIKNDFQEWKPRIVEAYWNESAIGPEQVSSVNAEISQLSEAQSISILCEETQDYLELRISGSESKRIPNDRRWNIGLCQQDGGSWVGEITKFFKVNEAGFVLIQSYGSFCRLDHTPDSVSEAQK
jgi:hypothetical protein